MFRHLFQIRVSKRRFNFFTFRSGFGLPSGASVKIFSLLFPFWVAGQISLRFALGAARRIVIACPGKRPPANHGLSVASG